MVVNEHLFNWPGVNLSYYYIYFLIAALIAGYLSFRSKSSFKFELFFLVFYLLTGNLNELLTISIPGFSSRTTKTGIF